MKILDFLIIPYYILLRKAKHNQLEASVFALSTLPILFTLISFIFWLVGYVLGLDITYLIVGVLMLGTGFAVFKYLLNYYLPRKKILDDLCEKYGKYKNLSYLFIIFYFLFSIFIFFYTIRFIY